MALLLSCSTLGSAELPQTPQRVPVVGCLINDQTGPARLQTGQSMPTPVDPRLAEQIAYYSAAQTPGIYAPKGWYCRGWSGSNGSILIVTPKRMAPPYYPVPTITAPAVMIQSSAGATSGRFHVAIVAAQLFPLVGDEFIARVRQEQLIPDSSFDAEPHPDDRLQYLSDRLVQFTTPPNRTGLGTDGLFEMSDLPVTGLIILNLGDELNSLTEVRVRVPAALNPVAAAIMQLETTCIQRHDGCQGLQ
ncbi:MAG: hypothetical protein ACHQDD_01405 [Steroidobacterales bacterium]